MTYNTENTTTTLKTKLAWIGMALAAATLMFFSVQRKMNSGLQNVDVTIQKVDGTREIINRKDVLKLFREHLGFDVEMAVLKELKIVELEDILQKDKRVKEVEVFLDSKNRLHVDIKQRNPIVRVNADNGEKYYLDEEGNRIPLKKKTAIRVPVATGNIAKYQSGFTESKNRTSLNDIFDIMIAIKNDPFVEALVEQIYVDEHDELILIPKLGREKILFGKYENVDKKFLNLKSFYREQMPREGWEKFANLDIRFQGQVLYSTL